MNDYGPESIRSYRYILVLIDNLSKFGWKIPFKNQYAQSKTDNFSQIVETSKRRRNLVERVDGTEYLNKLFHGFSNNNNIKRYYRKLSLGSVIAEQFIITTRNSFKKQVFEIEDADWIPEVPSVVDKNFYTIHSSTKMTPVQISMNKNEKKTSICILKTKDKNKNQKLNWDIWEI